MPIPRVRTVLTVLVVMGACAPSGPAQPCQSGHVHQALHDLLPVGSETHLAVRSGRWHDPRTWSQGRVPDRDALVRIPDGRRVVLDAVESTPLDTVRIDGALRFDPTVSTRLVVATLFSTATGRLEIGTRNRPVDADRTAEIVIRDAGPLDPRRDPEQLGRGVILRGPTVLHGAEKLAFAELKRDHPAGSPRLSLKLPPGQSRPRGWRVGDRLVVGGTSYDPAGNDADGSRFQDEEIFATRIYGHRIAFHNPFASRGNRNALRFDHRIPRTRARWYCALYVANLTRNVVIRSENPNVPVGERGHVMMMHTTDVLLRNVAFEHLGRSDKSRNVDDVGTNVDGSPGFGTNVRGRYALHLHRNLPPGGGPLPATCTPALVQGCVARGSPGWGFVHHDSHAHLLDNVAYDVAGSGFVAEAGNEIGLWRGNLAMKITGLPSRDRHLEINERLARYDFGFTGEGFWLQGAPRIDCELNVAHSCNGPGFALFCFADAMNGVRDATAIHQGDIAGHLAHVVTEGETIDNTNVPMERLAGLRAINCHTGFLSWYHHRNDDGQAGFTCPCDGNAHRARTVVEAFVFQSIFGNGIFTQYTTQTTFRYGLVIGDPENPVPVHLADDGAGRGWAVSQNGPAQNLHYRWLFLEGFERAVRVPIEGRGAADARPWVGSVMESVLIENCTHAFARKAVPWAGRPAFPEYFQLDHFELRGVPTGLAPFASFTATNIGGEGVVRLDASASFDPDADPSLEIGGNGIVSYGWDFDADGRIDRFGRVAHERFPVGAHPLVRLVVVDAQGQSTEFLQPVPIHPARSPEIVVDGDFDEKGPYLAGWELSTARAGEGWAVRDAVRENGGLRFEGQRFGVSGAAQIVFDDGAHRGMQAISLRLANSEGDARTNSIVMEVYGVRGEFQGSAEGDGPDAIGAIPMQATLLHSRVFGGSTHSVQIFSDRADFGDGYPFIYVQFRVRGVDRAAGDRVWIDRVSIGRQ